MSSADRVVAGLQELLGRGGWLAGDDIASYLVDFREDFRGTALGVARPASTEEVSRVVELSAANAVAILPQGGNSGLSGGSIPSVDRPTVIVSLTRMRAIEEVDAGGFTITAQAGVTVQELQEAAAAVDRLFAPDWGARGTATLGGAIATNGGGINVLRYGNTREQVMGVEVVLADGRVWNGLRALPKDNSGYDLKQLFIASEGTLGIVTRAVVRLHPKPAEHRTAFVTLTDIERLTDWYGLATSLHPGALSAFELIPEIGVGRVRSRSTPSSGPWTRFRSGTSCSATAVLRGPPISCWLCWPRQLIGASSAMRWLRNRLGRRPICGTCVTSSHRQGSSGATC